MENFLLTTQLYPSQDYTIENAVPIWRLCNTWIRIFQWDQQQQCIRLITLGQQWGINHLIYPNNLGWKWIKCFLVAPYPPPLIGPYDFISTADIEYDLMTDRLRHWILKASPHAWIWQQIGINEIVERHSRIQRQIGIDKIAKRHWRLLFYLMLLWSHNVGNQLLTWLDHVLLHFPNKYFF